ncbi:MAG: 3-phosphoserine/phosphohydroxythreonine transaminase [Acidobacteriota bacterium]
MTTDRVFNFSAGPGALPLAVLKEAQRSMLSYGDSGRSVMELSHRSPEYDAIHREALAGLRRLLAIPDQFAVLLLQGGASLQFSMVPMNLMTRHRRADYLVTGNWAKKALAEGRKVGAARVAASTEAGGFSRLPESDEIDLDPEADFLHLTSNNTLFGTQWAELPEAGDVPLAVDMSSDILSRPVPWKRLGLVYAGAQKNLGPAGVTVVVVRSELLERAPEDLPTMLNYRSHAAKDSLYNTPPTWAIYILGLGCRWVEEQGGVAAMEAAATERSARLYRAIDASDFYRGTAKVEHRSTMNIPFRLPSEALEAAFLRSATDKGMTNLKGHRSVGGIRASLYNAAPMAAVDALLEHMADFARDHG